MLEALKKTPSLFAPLELYAKILLKDRNFSRAIEQINIARRIVMDRSTFDLRANYRPFLQLEANYYLNIGDFDSARNIYQDVKFFSNLDRETLNKEIETIQSYKKGRSE